MSKKINRAIQGGSLTYFYPPTHNGAQAKAIARSTAVADMNSVRKSKRTTAK